MYYRYDVKRKNTRLIKFSVFLLIGGLILGSLIYFRESLMFWRYSANDLDSKIELSMKNEDPLKRISSLKELVPLCESYIKDNPSSAEASLLAGRLYFLIGQTEINGPFTPFVVHGFYKNLPAYQNNASFLESIKYLKKSIALTGKNEIPAKVLVLLAEASYYTNYNDIVSINNLLNKVVDPTRDLSREELRFYGAIRLMSQQDDSGLEYIQKSGDFSSPAEGILFNAVIFDLAGKYTRALVEYRKALEGINDLESRLLILNNMSDIYQKQSLFEDALAVLSEGAALDASNQSITIKMVQVYIQSGNKNKARELLKNLIKVDPSNTQAQEMLAAIK